MQVLKQIYITLTKDPNIQKFIKLTSQIAQKTKDVTPQVFSQSYQHKTLMSQLRNLKIQKLQQIFTKLPPLPKITAIILKSAKICTIAFLMIPSNSSFGWHDHTNMNGLSKCLCGEITIKTINKKYFQTEQKQKDIIKYPRQKIRTERLKSQIQHASCIYPQSYNIHKIETNRQQSAFLDILLPEYPDNSCNYFIEIQQQIVQNDQNLQILVIKKVKQSNEQVIGLEGLLKYYQRQKKINVKPN